VTIEAIEIGRTADAVRHHSGRQSRGSATQTSRVRFNRSWSRRVVSDLVEAVTAVGACIAGIAGLSAVISGGLVEQAGLLPEHVGAPLLVFLILLMWPSPDRLCLGLGREVVRAAGCAGGAALLTAAVLAPAAGGADRPVSGGLVRSGDGIRGDYRPLSCRAGHARGAAGRAIASECRDIRRRV
jgi:hypothetical protein